MRIIEKLPVPVVTLESVPSFRGNPEGAALFLLVLIERGSKDALCLIEHEKVHIIQQWAFGGLFAVIAGLLSIPWLVGLLFGFGLYAVGWFFIPFFQRLMEGMGDRVQGSCKDSIPMTPEEELALHMRGRIEDAWNDGEPSPFMFTTGDVQTWYTLLTERDEDE